MTAPSVTPSLTAAELELTYLAAELWNKYLALPGRPSNEAPEMQRDIHAIQQRIMARLARRCHPDVFHQAM